MSTFFKSSSIKHSFIRWAIVYSCLFCSFGVFADELRLAVAANFRPAMEELVKLYKTSSDAKLQIIPGSSGKLFAQIVHHAPYDCFFSADEHKIEELEKRSLLLENSRFIYATGRLALATTNPKLALTDAQALSQIPTIQLALANPRLAPYGQASTEVLNYLKRNRKIASQAVLGQTVIGENVAQVFHFVKTKNVDLGFVALSQVYTLNEETPLNYWLIPKDWHQPIKQEAAILKTSRNIREAKRFMQFLRKNEARTLLTKFGYEPDDLQKRTIQL